MVSSPELCLRSMILTGMHPSCSTSSYPGCRAARTTGRPVVVAPGFLQDPEVRRWLNGVEPAWTMLDFDSYNALHDEPSAHNWPIRLKPNLTEPDLPHSPVHPHPPHF